MNPAPLSWLGIVRLGLAQTALGAVVVLTTSTINRLMVVELALPATLPGLLVGIHYAVQMLRPRMGHGSDAGGRRTPWIIGGMAVLGLGGILAALATWVMASSFVPGLALAVLGFLMVGAGVAASGTSLLVLLAARTAPARRPAAASIVWIMMIAGFVVTTAITGRLLDPFSFPRLVTVTACVSAIALTLSVLSVWGVEGDRAAERADRAPSPPFRQALAEVWAEPAARRFTIFVFVSMLAYSAQDLILEPFAGAVFGMTLGQSTSLSSLQHGGVLAGMIVVALAGSLLKLHGIASLRVIAIAGCLGASVMLAALAVAARMPGGFPLAAAYAALGLANGVFAAAAIASMMQMVALGGAGREGVRMGLWGAAQAIAFGLGGLAGTIVLDLGRAVMTEPQSAYALVFAVDALMFLVAAWLAFGIGARVSEARPIPAALAPANGD